MDSVRLYFENVFKQSRRKLKAKRRHEDGSKRRRQALHGYYTPTTTSESVTPNFLYCCSIPRVSNLPLSLSLAPQNAHCSYTHGKSRQESERDEYICIYICILFFFFWFLRGHFRFPQVIQAFRNLGTANRHWWSFNLERNWGFGGSGFSHPLFYRYFFRVCVRERGSEETIVLGFLCLKIFRKI